MADYYTTLSEIEERYKENDLDPHVFYSFCEVLELIKEVMDNCPAAPEPSVYCEKCGCRDGHHFTCEDY